MRLAIRIVALLGLLVSLGMGVFATQAWLMPSEEDQISEERAQAAFRKDEESKAAKTPAERRKLEQEALELMTSARLWAEGARNRLRTNRLGMVLCVGGALASLVVLLLTRRRARASA